MAAVMGNPITVLAAVSPPKVPLRVNDAHAV